MLKVWAVAAALPLLLGQICLAQAGEPLALERTISLPDVRGRIDHLAVDLQGKRLFVAELGNDTVDVIDLVDGRRLHRISGLHAPQGVAYVPGPGLIVVADADDGVVSFYGGSDYRLRGSVDLGSDADNIRRDTHGEQIVVGFGNGELATIDPARRLVLRKVRLSAHPEAFQLDPHSSRAFVNLPDASQIAVIDLAAARQIASWPTRGAADNFPMAIDSTGSMIAVVFRSPPRLELLASQTGAVSGSDDTCGDADDVFFDGKRQRIYVSCGSGAVDVFSGGAEGLRRIARISTPLGSRTSLFVAELDRLFVASRADPSRAEAAILVFRPS